MLETLVRSGLEGETVNQTFLLRIIVCELSQLQYFVETVRDYKIVCMPI